MIARAKVHDMDKMVMYLFLGQHESQMRHVETQLHHLECTMEKSYEDLVETVIDYECAPYTKPDKPLNCYDFVLKLRELGYLCEDSDIYRTLMEIMKSLGIDKSGTVEEDVSGRDYISHIPEVTEEMILMEVLTYIDENRDNSLDYVRNIWQGQEG